MSEPDLVFRLDAIRADLIEARRYVASDPTTAGRLIDAAFQTLTRGALFVAISTAYVVRPLCRNLLVGSGAIHASPETTDAAIRLAVWELGSLASELRKADEEPARDAELTEAFGVRESTP